MLGRVARHAHPVRQQHQRCSPVGQPRGRAQSRVGRHSRTCRAHQLSTTDNGKVQSLVILLYPCIHDSCLQTYKRLYTRPLLLFSYALQSSVPNLVLSFTCGTCAALLTFIWCESCLLNSMRCCPSGSCPGWQSKWWHDNGRSLFMTAKASAQAAGFRMLSFPRDQGSSKVAK